MMAVKRCPPPEMLSAFIDRELQSSEYSALSSHVLQCARCGAILSGLRDVDEALVNAPVPSVQHRRATVKVSGPRHGFKRVAVLLVVLAIVLSVAAGCAFAARVWGVFRTEHHVVTRPAVDFPADVEKGVTGGREFEATPSVEKMVRPVEEVEDSLGAHLLEPSDIPTDYVLVQRNSPLRMSAEILYLGSEGRSISIRESHYKYSEVERPPIPPSAAQSLEVNGHPAIYVKGGWYQEASSDVPSWREDMGHTLLFEVGELTVEIGAPLDISRQDLIRIAESMR